MGTDLTGKLKALDLGAQCFGRSESELTGTLQALVRGKDADALAKVFQIAHVASPTPEPKGLAKEAGNLATAFVVQRNFAALEGANGDVATLVASLRRGEVAGPAPAIQRIAKNANLTAPQKQLIGSVAGQYVPRPPQGQRLAQKGTQRASKPAKSRSVSRPSWAAVTAPEFSRWRDDSCFPNRSDYACRHAS